MARDIGDVLAPALNAGPVPSNGPELVAYAGGTEALTRQLSGMDGPPRKADYPTAEAYQAARTDWRSASRNAQRWAKGRTPKPGTVTPGEKSRIRRNANARKREELSTQGMRARLKARIVVDTPGGATDDRVRVIPPQGFVRIEAATVRGMLEALGDDEEADATAEFVESFLDSYGWEQGADVAEIESVIWLHLWPDDGSPEPS